MDNSNSVSQPQETLPVSDSLEKPNGAVGENVAGLNASLLAKGGNGGHYYYRYDVEFDGDLVVQDSKDPECDLAKVLEARGYSGVVTMLDGKTGRPRTIINIAKAERLAARETSLQGPHFVKWHPFEGLNAALKRG